MPLADGPSSLARFCWNEGVLDEQSELADLTLYEAAETLQNRLVAHATDGTISAKDYSELRRRVLDDPRSKSHVPSFIRTCRSPDQFWGYIKHKFGTYAERR